MTDNSRVPYSVGIIMDGNRRWAKENSVPSLEGHRAGAEKLKEFLPWALERGIKEIIVYAFSTENWNRGEDEVKYLLALIGSLLDDWIDDVLKQGGRLQFIGQLDRLPDALQKKIQQATERTKGGEKGTLIIALSYGGRAEILSAVNKLLTMDREVVTEDDLWSAMWSADFTDPDLIIRTGGEKRLSNFLTWQSTYSELFFTDTKWPDFSKEEFFSILDQFSKREQRHGT
ncbi:MAG: polyprenyl diphosphate synthase [Candidatus Pacebacteria bacterium]|nr:polyprenyl diphosphate synthase [Candidatus Paceibacterota bacterium]